MTNPVFLQRSSSHPPLLTQKFKNGYKARMTLDCPARLMCVIHSTYKVIKRFYRSNQLRTSYPSNTVPLYVQSGTKSKYIKKTAVRLPFRIDLLRSANTVCRVQLIFESQLLGSGFYKSVYPAFSLHVNFKTNEFIGGLSVLTKSIRPKNESCVLDYVMRGVKIEKRIYGSVKPFYWPNIKTISRIGNHLLLETTREYFPDVLDIYLTGRGKDLPLDKKIDFFIQVLDTLRHWHRRGWTHNDVKMDNIFLRYDGSVYLGDCDLAEKIQYNKNMKHKYYSRWSTARSYGYISPESDLYAVIASMMHMIFGNTFFPYLDKPMELMHPKNQAILFENAAKESDSEHLLYARREIFKLFISMFEKGLHLNHWLKNNPEEAEKLNRHDPEIFVEIEKRTISCLELRGHLTRIQRYVSS